MKTGYRYIIYSNRQTMAQEAPTLATETPEKIDESYVQHTFSAWPNVGYSSWTLDTVRAARVAQMEGDFTAAAPLGEAMKTDPAIYAALLNRIAPHRGLPREVIAGDRLRAEAAETFGRDGPALEPAVVADSFEMLAQHGLWIGQNHWTPRPDGTRIDVRLKPWPMRAVKLNRWSGALEAHTTEGYVPITHGDGKWVAVSLHAEQPWQWGAVKSLAISWVSRTGGKRDRNMHAETHALGKIIGTMPEKMAIGDNDGQKFVTALQKLRNFRAGGAFPYGSKVELLEAMAQSWQIFSELFKGENADIAMVYLGQDGTVTNEGGNYIKAAQLFGVRNDLVEGDLGAVARGLNSGVLLPWALLNVGDPELAPELAWLFPDPDEAERRAQLAAQHKALIDTLAGYQAGGFEVDQGYVDELAASFGVRAPRLAPAASAVAADLQPLDITPSAKETVVRVDEVRTREGLEPVGGEDGRLFLPQFQQKLAPAIAEAASAAAGEPQDEGSPAEPNETDPSDAS
jgi:hypothetical protein